MSRLRPVALGIAVIGAVLFLGSPAQSRASATDRVPARFASALVLSAGQLATLTSPTLPSSIPNAAREATGLAVPLLGVVVGVVVLATARLTHRGHIGEHPVRAPPVFRFG